MKALCTLVLYFHNSFRCFCIVLSVQLCDGPVAQLLARQTIDREVESSNQASDSASIDVNIIDSSRLTREADTGKISMYEAYM